MRGEVPGLLKSRLDAIGTQSEPYWNRPKETFSIPCQSPLSFHLCWRNCFEHIPSLLPRARGLPTDAMCPIETPFNRMIARWTDRPKHNYIAIYSLHRKKQNSILYSMYCRWLDASQSTSILFLFGFMNGTCLYLTCVNWITAMPSNLPCDIHAFGALVRLLW